MCLKPKVIDPIPEATARIAKAAFPRGNPYLQMRDEFGPLFEDEQFAISSPRVDNRQRRPGAWHW